MFRSITNNTAKNLSAGGTISGNVTIEGDLTVNGDGAGSYDEIVNGQLVAFRDDSSTVGTNDNIVIENDGTGDASLKFSLTGATDWFAYVDNSDSDKFKIRRSTSDFLIITETGSVGLGVSPSYPLHIENASDTVAYFKSTDNNGQIAVVDDDTTAYFGANGSRAFMGTASGLAGTTNLVVDSNGNVGIGETSPEARLTVSPGTVGTTSLGGRSINYGLNINTSSGRSGVTVKPANNYAIGDDNAGFQWLYPFDDGGNGDFKAFRVSEGATLVDKFYATRDGQGYFASNVGVGTTSPMANSDGIVGLEISSGASTGLTLKSTSSSQIYSLWADSSGNLKVQDNTNNETRLTVDSSGNATFAGDVTIGSNELIFDAGEKVFSTGGYVVADGDAGFIARDSGVNKFIINGNTATFAGDVTVAGGDITLTNATPTIVAEQSSGATRAKIKFPTFGSDGGITFETTTNGAGAMAEAMRIDEDQNVGIGTTNPSDYNALAHNLVVYENSDSGITIASATTGTGSLYFADGTTGDEAYKGSIEYSHGSNALSLRANSVVKFVLDTNSVISLSNNDGGNTGNTIFGHTAWQQSSNVGADYNTIFGQEAMGSGNISSAERNTGIGFAVMRSITTGDSNVAVGADSLYALKTGSANIAIGRDSFKSASFGETGNVSIGYQAMSSLNEGANVSASADNNIAIGQSALLGGAFAGNDKVVNDNIAIGAFALDATSDNSHTGLIAIGRDALGALTSGGSNTAIGYESQLYQTDGSNNVSLGFKALRNADNGESFNTVLGTKACEFVNHASSDGNTIVGMQAMVGGTGARSYNTVMGYRAMGSSNTQNNVGGNENVFIGAYSGNGTWTTAGCDLNTAVGYQSMQGAMNGALQNSAFGANSLGGVTSGDNNVGVGFKAGFTGTDNVTTGEQNTLIGASTQATASGAVNQTVIGYGAISQSNNSVTLGNTSVTSIFAPTKTAIQSYGTVAITDGSTITLAGSNLGAAILCIYEASGGIGGVFALSYQFAAVQLAGSSDTSTSDSAGDVCVINGTNNHTVTIKNNTGAQKNFRIMIYSAAFN